MMSDVTTLVRAGAQTGLLAALVAVFGLAHAADPTQVKTASGIVRGSMQEGVVSFKGIPLAQPPVGALRWRPPQPVQRWSGVRNATAYGPDCMQIPFPGDAAPLGVKPEEDCLYLNVWTPERSVRGKLPVMVWIYGGGFVNGGSSPSVYDGSAFARDGVVLVSFNYRLGNFGFFAHPALSAEQAPGPLVNYALMDQIAALEWVQKNVAAFGGDPHNVTIFGESAGGGSVHALMTSPLARGLFQKAIVESAGGRPGRSASRPVAGAENSAESVGLALAKRFGIEGQGPEALAKLRMIPADQLVSGLNMATAGRDPTYVGGPVVDGQLNVGTPIEAYAAGKGAKVPFMIGANSLDIGFMDGKTLDDLYAQYGPDAQQARSVYGSLGTSDVRAVAFIAGGDQMMAEPARAIARVLTAQGQPVYQFRFSYVAESQRAQFPGAFHATEIPFVFDTVAARYGKDLTPADEAIARIVHGYWVAFARDGKPDLAGQPSWPAYSRQNEAIMDFTAQGPVAGADPWGPRLDLAERLSDRRQQAAAGKKAGH
jgi:para-nitrobenzyl esterase